MGSFSLGTTWEEMMAFVRREGALLLPVAMATFAVGGILMNQAVPEGAMAPGAPVVVSSKLLLLVPALLALVLGNLAISLIVLVPGISVGEAMRRGAARISTVLSALLIVAFATGVAAFALIALLTIALMLAGIGPQAAASPAVGLMIGLMLLISAPLLLFSPIAAIEPVGPVEGLRRVLRLSRGNFVRLLVTFTIQVMLSVMVTGIARLVLLSLVKLVALAVGEAELLELLADVVVAAIAATISMGGAVYVALAYRRLAG